MIPTAFSLFPLLPLELRQYIYLLATPPRVVELWERCDQDFEQFSEELRSKVYLELSPELVHFAYNWIPRVPTRINQPLLERFGFHSSKPRRHPWELSPTSPEIFMPWLVSNPNEAWEFARKFHLYSKIAVPTLLHTCSESRDYLKRRGYELAFQTRSAGPRTWFNFSRDTLFLDSGCDDSPYDSSGGRCMLSGSLWHVGRFSPKDLLRVENLALDGATICLHPKAMNKYSQLSKVIRLFGNLKELFLVEWFPDKGWQELCFDAPDALVQEPWGLTQVMEVDALIRLFSPNLDSWTYVTPMGKFGEFLVSHREERGPVASFLRDMEYLLKKRMIKLKSLLIAANEQIPVTPWHIPNMHATHIVTGAQLKTLAGSRHKALSIVQDLQRQWASITDCAADSAETRLKKQEARKEFADTHWPMHGEPCCAQAQSSWHNKTCAQQQRKWWVQDGSIAVIRNQMALLGNGGLQ